jgi:hypothetical protein
MSLERILNFAEIETGLFMLKKLSKGKMELQILGHSHEGRPLYAALIGYGDTRIWLQGRVHGNEPYGAEASLDILANLALDKKENEEILSKATFMVIPCYNPDGSERNWRSNALGMDLNRQWGHLGIFKKMAAEWDIEVPPIASEMFMNSVESQHYWYAWANFKPHYVIDYHHEDQNYCSSDTNKPATIAITTPGNPTFHAKQDLRIARENSKLAIIAYDAVNKLNYCKPTRYPLPDQAFPQGMGAGVTVGVPGPKGEESGWASSCVYFENMPAINGPLSGEDSIQQFVVGGWGVINAIVSGQLNEADPERFWDKNKIPVMVECSDNNLG